MATPDARDNKFNAVLSANKIFDADPLTVQTTILPPAEAISLSETN